MLLAIFLGSISLAKVTKAKVSETPVLWPPHVKSWLVGKDSDAGRDWGQEEKGTTEDEMAGWHHWLDGREFVWTLGVGDGQGGLACCNSWGHKASDTTERLKWTELNWTEDLVKLKIFCKTKETINKTKGQSIEWKKIFANGMSSKELTSKTESTYTTQYQKTSNLVKKWAQDSRMHFLRKTHQWPSDSWKNAQHH